MIGVALPSGAREVRLTFAMASYARGKLVTWASLAGAVLLVLAGRFRRKVADG
jgi:hypothetical protein